jgi:hypothetical protein
MKQISLVGASSRDIDTLNCNQECSNFKPDHFEWDMTGAAGEVGVFIDHAIPEVGTRFMDFKTKIAMLWEPWEYRPQHYEKAHYYYNFFDMILTHDTRLLVKGGKYMFYYAGGQFVHTPSYLPNKTEFVSIVTGWKKELPGHRLRFDAAKLIAGEADIFTYPFNPKSKAIHPYMFSIVIENVKQDYWFTEKLIDCLVSGTVPIYWGSNTDEFFDSNGIIHFDTLDNLRKILENLSPKDYYDRMSAIQTNFERAKEYAVTENYLSEWYPSVFK